MYKRTIIKSIFAGFLIGFAGCIFVLVTSKINTEFGKFLGSTLFSIGLISVILLEAFLFTGKIGYVNSKETCFHVLLGLAFNLVTAFVVGLLFRIVFGVQTIFDSRLAKTWYQLLFDGVGCGILIYLAVELYKKTNNLVAIIFPVVAFILAGMEHSIADACYFGMSELSFKGLLNIFIVILGNSIGSLLTRFLQVNFEKLTNKD